MDSSSKIVLEGPTKESIRRIENTVSDILTSMEIIKRLLQIETLPAGSMPANNVHSSSNGQFAHRMRSSDVSRMIKGYICYPKFKGTDPKKIAENNSRPGWDLTSNFHTTSRKSPESQRRKAIRRDRKAEDIREQLFLLLARMQHMGDTKLLSTESLETSIVALPSERCIFLRGIRQ
ncbi:hypothetical protein J3Q64DRAFT_1704313 [Phycomyces blakesleeanus]|uniref:Uncharacterized protein n=1 Tax=Phycomyces blakesleeanus TaxID=4837 RepID=A0ABR3AIT1_PHYBL